jgi:transcriptional regulator with XRE-family HTH domain
MTQEKLRWFRGRTQANIGDALRELREERGLSQEQLAVILKSSRATISRLERGGEVSSAVILRAAAELGHELVLVPRSARVIVESLAP